MPPTPLTYPEVGVTRHTTLPSGYHHVHESRVIGRGPECFQAASTSLMSWQMHQKAGLRVTADALVEQDVEAVVLLGPGRLAIKAPVRVVYVVDEPTRRGFGYGTLPGHPECGEESFVLDIDEDQMVTFTIRAFSRGATWWARAAGPLGRGAQAIVTRRYLRALA